MSLSSYADLLTQVGNWLRRSDLTSTIPDFVVLFEAAAARRMKVRGQQVTTTLTPTNGVVALPTDYFEGERLTWTGSPRVDLQYLHPSVAEAQFPDRPSDTPGFFTIEGSNIRVFPTDSTALEFVYFQKTPALSTQLNWLYTNHPDAYLNGTLYEAFKYLRDMEKMALYKAARDEIFDEISVDDFRQAGTLSVRVVGTVV